MVIPAIIQNHFLSSKIALYRHNILKVQNNNKGTSGVELKEIMEIKIVVNEVVREAAEEEGAIFLIFQWFF